MQSAAISRTSSTRLVDYVVVIEFDASQIRHGVSVGSIIQRFPKCDWPDISLSPSLEVFSQPQGWALSTEIHPAHFFVNTLTDIMGARQYACCLQLYESCDIEMEEMDDDTTDNEPNLFKPKVIVILSRFPFFDLFRNCLNRILLALLEEEEKAENMVATIVSSVYLMSGMPSVSFSMSSDRLSVRAPKSPTIPVTSDKVAYFLHHLGTIHNILTLLSAVMTDRKILFRSSSLSLLADSCYALRSLLYPFDYPHTYVPVLPHILIEYLESPTPYIMGVLSSVRLHYTDLDAVVVDLDIGEVFVPPSVCIPTIPQPFHKQLVQSLQMVLYPGIATADDAWKIGQPPLPSSELQASFSALIFTRMDKRIRACFVCFFANLLIGYRCCLEVIRVHTPPLIVFHKSAFLGLREFSLCPLIRAFLDSLLFQSFISERGLPFRLCDLFDEHVAQIGEHSAEYFSSKANLLKNVVDVSEKLLENERQEVPFTVTPFATQRRFNAASPPSKIRPFNEDVACFSNLFRLVSKMVECNLKSGSCKVAPVLCPRRVQTNAWINRKEEYLNASSRRLQVLCNCLHQIFECKLSDARKIMCAVELSMRSVTVRVALCQLLWTNLTPINKATVLPQQFELITRLMNCALNHESREDEHGIAYAMLYLANMYCRRLTAGVHQFAYTCIQEHAVWDNQQFWEAAFFHDVHRQIRRLYLPVRENNDCPFSLKENVTDTWNLMEKPSGMDLVSEQLASLCQYNEAEVKKRAAEENSVVYGQAKHYINLMVYLRIPLDVTKLRRVNVRELERRSDRNSRKRDFDDETELSMSESEVESGFAESDSSDLGNSSVRWISRLIDRICSSAGLDQTQIENLCGEIPGFVALHIDNLDQVYTESKRLSPMHKPKLLHPTLMLPAERIICGGLRVFLLSDGRSNSTIYNESPQSLLPAEGAVFLTNYRIVFKGQPCDPFLCEQVVVRTMSVMSITKEKPIGDTSSNSSHLEGIPIRVAHQLHDAFQIRSCDMQLIKIAFDEEVSNEKAEEFMEALNRLRWPSMLPHTLFAYSTASAILSSSLNSTTSKHKYGTIKELRKTLMRNPLKDKKRLKLPPRALPSFPSNIDPTFGITSPNSSPRSAKNDFLDISDVSDTTFNNIHHHYMMDYDRLGVSLGNFRLTNLNRRCEVTKSYPKIVVIPSCITDNNLVKISKGFRHNRFPFITWKSECGALLVRGAGFSSQTVVTRLRKQANFLGGNDQQNRALNGSSLSVHSRDISAPNSIEMQERYISAFALLSPRASNTDGHSLMSESVESILSLYSMITADGVSLNSATPDLYRKSQTEIVRHTTNFVRSNANKNILRAAGSERFLGYSEYGSSQSRNVNGGATHSAKPLISLSRKACYVLGDRNQAKMLKLDKCCEFIPINYPSAHNAKIAFKKFLRAMCPSWSYNSDQSGSYLKQIDDSTWLHMVSSLLRLACAIVDLIDVQLSSVVICLEDGWDATCQISSLSQILLDPYYRTFEGFRVLIEKEWLAMGHRFSHRYNHSTSSQSSGIAPMFLMFLDAVHQIWEQYPSAFEFNDFFLRFISYHSTSACFRTFLLDCEAERIRFDSLALSTGDPRTASIWTFIDEKRVRSPIFDNFSYVPELYTVMRPQSSIASLNLWSFYLEDYLAHGSPYDIELAEIELQQREDEHQESFAEVGTSKSMSRRLLDANYHCTHLITLDAFTACIETFSRLRPLLTNEEDASGDTWMALMAASYERTGQIMCFENDEESSILNVWNRYVQRAVHKKETVKLLMHGVVRGQNNNRVRESTASSISSHQFVSQSATPGDTCAVCHQNVPGVVVRSVHRCVNCAMICHEKCSHLATSSCHKTAENRAALIAKYDTPSPKKSLTAYIPENQTLTRSTSHLHGGVSYNGYLMKKGATFKMWKPRWFVLDSNRHQLRYYENETDLNCRGMIELADIKSVEICPTYVLKKPLIEVKTFRRLYSLLADSKVDADTWLEKILAALHD